MGYSKIRKVLDIVILGLATLTGIAAGGAGIAVAGIAIYLLGHPRNYTDLYKDK
jgi:hypothetical protein